MVICEANYLLCKMTKYFYELIKYKILKSSRKFVQYFYFLLTIVDYVLYFKYKSKTIGNLSINFP